MAQVLSDQRKSDNNRLVEKIVENKGTAWKRAECFEGMVLSEERMTGKLRSTGKREIGVNDLWRSILKKQDR